MYAFRAYLKLQILMGFTFSLGLNIQITQGMIKAVMRKIIKFHKLPEGQISIVFVGKPRLPGSFDLF